LLQNFSSIGFRRMTLDAMRTLVTIAEHGSFAAAARVLDLSQSAVSLHIKTLEDDLALALFDRSSRPPTLTDVGAAAVVRARAVLGLVADFRAGLADGDALQGRLQIGAVGSTLTGLLPLVLSELRALHPGLHVEIVSGVSSQLISLVHRRRLDAAVVSDYTEADRSIEWRPFLRERLVMIAPPDSGGDDVHRLARAFPFIRYIPSAAVGRVIDTAIQRIGIAPRESMRLDWLEAIEAMVANGLGVAIVPDRHIRPLERVRVVKLPGAGHFRTLGLVELVSHPKRRFTDLVMAKLFDLSSTTRKNRPALQRGRRARRD
jgi:DNA-binding transcriptional LysR family regulator